MDSYVITFSTVMAWVIPAALGVLTFFIKRWFNGVEQTNQLLQQQIQEGNKKIKEMIEKNDAKVNERIDRLEEKTEQNITDIQKEINDIKGDFSVTFVLREDFFRSMNGVEDRIRSIDSKLDRLIMMNKENK